MRAALRLSIAAALAALCGLAHAELMRVSQQQIKVVPNASAYSAGYCIGGVLAVPSMQRPQGPGGTVIFGVTVVDPQHQTAANDAMTLLVFNQQPTGSYTDHTNCQVAAADVPSLVAQLSIASTNCVQDEGPATTVCTISPTLAVSLPPTSMPIVNGQLWIVPIAVATPTYGSSALLYFNFMATPF